MKIASFILALFLLFKPIFPLVEYAAFYDYIKNELCVNKEVVASTCNGKCYLSKQLAKAATSENNNEKSPAVFIDYSIVYFQNTVIKNVFAFLKEQNPKLNIAYSNSYKFSYATIIFHPPIG